jgi:hypothetical protein
MLTLLVILGIWTALSLPMSVVLGCSIHHGMEDAELVGMDGTDAVYLRGGRFERVSLVSRTPA